MLPYLELFLVPLEESHMGHTPHKVALHQITTYTHELIPLDRGAVTQTVTLFPFPGYKYRWASLSVILSTNFSAHCKADGQIDDSLLRVSNITEVTEVTRSYL